MLERVKWLVPLMLLCLGTAQGPAAQEADSLSLSLSFEQALEQTTGKSHVLLQSQALIEQKKYEQKAAKGLYMPKISLSANYVLMSEDLTMDLTPVRDAITPLYEALGKYGNFSGVPNPDPTTSGVMPILPDNISTAAVRDKLMKGLDHVNAAEWEQMIQKKQFGTINAGFVQPIYTGGKIILANQAAALKVDEASQQRSEKYAQVYTELVERYYALALSRKVTEVRRLVEQTMQAHNHDAQKLMSEGIIANAEYLHARVYLSDAERELKKSLRQEEIVNQALLNTMAIESQTKITPVSGLFYLQSIEPLDYFITQAMDNSPLLKQVDTKKKLAEKAYKAEVASLMPNLAAMGTYDIANKDLSDYVPDYMVGVGLTWTIFEGTARPKKIKAARFQMEQVDRYSDKAESDIRTMITKLYQELNMCMEQMHETESALQFADEYFRVTQKSFSEGLTTTTQLADASLQVAKVKIEQYNIMYQFDLALSRLLYFAGCPDTFTRYQSSSEAIFIQDNGFKN